ncbi:unannotated protein [freshwater metagenome]|uniref:Unannotated protein n=1 Tax=freshwater metagenome TaxID=449393 RepID=A0A6J7G267_9ZZZZ
MLVWLGSRNSIEATNQFTAIAITTIHAKRRTFSQCLGDA